MDKLAELEKELLADMEENPVEYTETVNSVFEIDSNLRTINIPVTVKNIGVESDDDVKRLEFTMPKQYGEFDLSQFRIRINYVNANGDKSIYLVEDKKVSGDNITFSWLVGRNVTKYKGQVNFIVCLKLSDEKGEILKELNTTLCRLEVLEGLEVVPVIDEKTTDIIEQLLRMVETETTGTVQKVTEEGKKQVAEVQKAAQGITADREQINANKEGIAKLKEEIANKTGTGLSTEAIDKLEEVGNYLAYTTADGGSKWTELISILRNVELSNSAGLWEVGGVQPIGIGSTSTIRLRTVATLPYEVKKISVDDGYSYILVVYSEAQTEVPTDTNTVLLTGKGYYNPNGISGNVSTDSFLVSSGTYLNGELLISEVRANINSIYGNTAGDRAHFRILLKNNDDTTLTADDGLHIHLWG